MSLFFAATAAWAAGPGNGYGAGKKRAGHAGKATDPGPTDWLVHPAANHEYWLPPGWRFTEGCDIPSSLISVRTSRVAGASDRFVLSTQFYGKARVVSLYATHVSSPRTCRQLNLFLGPDGPTFAARRQPNGELVRADGRVRRERVVAGRRRRAGKTKPNRVELDQRKHPPKQEAPPANETIEWNPRRPLEFSFVVFLPGLAGHDLQTAPRLQLADWRGPTSNGKHGATWEGTWKGPCHDGWCEYVTIAPDVRSAAQLLRDPSVTVELEHDGAPNGTGRMPMTQWGDEQDPQELFRTRLSWKAVGSDLSALAVVKKGEVWIPLDPLVSSLLPPPLALGLEPVRGRPPTDNLRLDPPTCATVLANRSQRPSRAKPSSPLPQSCRDGSIALRYVDSHYEFRLLSQENEDEQEGEKDAKTKFPLVAHLGKQGRYVEVERQDSEGEPQKIDPPNSLEAVKPLRPSKVLIRVEPVRWWKPTRADAPLQYSVAPRDAPEGLGACAACDASKNFSVSLEASARSRNRRSRRNNNNNAPSARKTEPPIQLYWSSSAPSELEWFVHEDHVGPHGEIADYVPNQISSERVYSRGRRGEWWVYGARLQTGDWGRPTKVLFKSLRPEHSAVDPFEVGAWRVKESESTIAFSGVALAKASGGAQRVLPREISRFHLSSTLGSTGQCNGSPGPDFELEVVNGKKLKMKACAAAGETEVAPRLLKGLPKHDQALERRTLKLEGANNAPLPLFHYQGGQPLAEIPVLLLADCSLDVRAVSPIVGPTRDGSFAVRVSSDQPHCLARNFAVEPLGKAPPVPAGQRAVEWQGDITDAPNHRFYRLGTIDYEEVREIGQNGEIEFKLLERFDAQAVELGVTLTARTAPAVKTSDIEVTLPLPAEYLEVPGFIRDDLPYLAYGRPNLLWMPKVPLVQVNSLWSQTTSVRPCRLDELVAASTQPGVIFGLDNGVVGLEVNDSSRASDVGFCFRPGKAGELGVDFRFEAGIGINPAIPSRRTSDSPSFQVDLGSGQVSIAKVTRPVYVPLNLADRAEVRCGSELPYRDAAMIRTIKRRNLTDCVLVLDLRPPEAMSSPDLAIVEGPGAFTPVMEKIGEQQIEVKVSLRRANSEDEPPSWSKLIVLNKDLVVNDKTYRHGKLTVELGDLRTKLDSPKGYDMVHFEVQHVAAEKRSGRLENSVVPFSGEFDVADVNLLGRVRVLPAMTTRSCRNRPGRRSCDTVNNRAARYYFSALGSVTGFRFPHSGNGVTTSSEFYGIETASFDYGAIFIIEGWDYTTNRPFWKFFNPQLHVGALGPKNADEFKNGKDFTASVAIVGGLGFRPPTASKPDGAPPEMQVGPYIWGIFPIGLAAGNGRVGVMAGFSLAFASFGS